MKAPWLLAAAVLLAGCGHHAVTAAVTPASAPIVAKAVPVALLHDTPAAVSPTAVSTSPAAVAVAPTATLGLAASSCLGLGACQDGTPLQLQNVAKTKQGLFWRKLHVTGQVHNPGATALSGTVTIKFLKSGQVVQTEQRTISALASGQTLPFQADSNEASDDVDVSVSTVGITTSQAP